MSLNRQQQRVFDAPISRNIAVSAGAGTGKSRTLKTKVLDLITNKGIKPSEFLIVTFTNEATNSLRNDIKKAVREKGLKDIYSEVDSMHIDTIDAFRLFIVKKYSRVLGLSNDISVLDDSINKLEKLKIYEKLIEDLYEKEDQTLKEYITDFVSKNDGDMQNLILLASNFIDTSKYTKEEYLQKYYNAFLDDTVMKEKLNWYLGKYYEKVPVLVSRLFDILEDIPDVEIKGELKENPNKTFLADKYADLEFASTVDEIIEGLKKAQEVSGSIKPQYKFDDYEECGAINKELKKFRIYDIKEILEVDLKYNQKYIPFFLSIAYDLKAELEKFKRTYNLYTFADIAELALKVLENEEALNEIKSAFKIIMIDEYQDNSDIDDEFFTKIANNNLFLVGDVKQSIYGFKGANPEKFNKKFKEISSENFAIDKSEPFTMNINYRSRKEILDAVNDIFNSYMTDSRGGVNYKTENHSLIYEANETYDNAGETSDVDKGIKSLMSLSDEELIEVYNKAGNDNKTISIIKGDATTKYILTCALNIAERINKGAKVARNEKIIKDNKEENHAFIDFVKFSDFGILTRKGFDVNKCRDIFSHLGIPANFVVEEEITSSVMVETMLSIIRCLNIIIKSNFSDLEFENENVFKLSFVSILRSFLYETDDFEIYKIVANTEFDKEKNKRAQNLEYRSSAIYQKLVAFAKEHINDSLSSLFEAIFEEFNFVNNLDKLGNAIEYIQKYSLLLEKIKSMDNIAYQIDDLIFFFENIDKLGLKIEVRLGSDSTNAVVVETIHKSKGLEFPIVYVECSGKFKNNGNDLSRKIKTSYFGSGKFGYYLPRKTSGEPKTFFVNDYSSYMLKQNSLSEETRLFYVALTRAKEVCVCVYKEPLKEIPEKDECNKYQEIVAASGYAMPLDFYGFADSKVSIPHEKFVSSEVEMRENPTTYVEKIVEQKHPSITLEEDVDTELLKTGIRFHEYMELVNLHDKDTSFITNPSERLIVDKVLKNKLFEKLPDDSKIFKEYKYLDESGVSGIIDLLLVYDDHCVIIDYKLKNADEEKYAKQLEAYRAYVEKTFKLKAECHLLSILEN